MASIPQFYTNYTLAADFMEFPSSAAATCIIANNNSVVENNTMSMWSQDSSFIPLIDNGSLDHIVSPDFEATASAWLPAYSSEQPATMVDMVVPAISDSEMGFYGGGVGGLQNIGGGFQLPCIGEFREECGFAEDVKPPAFPNSTAGENWGIQGNHISANEEPNVKVGRYSEEERKERILRYLKKRNQRNFNKTIKYACRKTLADRRVRVRGRFARNKIEQCEEEMVMKKIENTDHTEDLYGSDSIQFQLKNLDEEDWLHEAMESLVFLSQCSPDDM